MNDRQKRNRDEAERLNRRAAEMRDLNTYFGNELPESREELRLQERIADLENRDQYGIPRF